MPASARSAVRYDWKKNEVQGIYGNGAGHRHGSNSDANFQGTAGRGAKAIVGRGSDPVFLAGANSIFVGEKLLTTPNPGVDEDDRLLQTLGMKPLESHAV